jgi:hypothetical protein
MDNSIPQKRIEKHGQLNETFKKNKQTKMWSTQCHTTQNIIDELKLKESIS